MGIVLRVYAWMQDQTITWGTLGFFACIPVAILISGIFVVAIVQSMNAPIVPYCQEDEIIIGIGSFDDEYWDEYICFHADRLVVIE